MNLEGDINEARLLQEHSPIDRYKSRTLKVAKKPSNISLDENNLKQDQMTLHEKSPPNKNKKKINFQFDED